MAIALISIFLSFRLQAEVTRAQLSSDIIAKEPIDDLGTLFFGDANQINKVFYFTQIENLNNEVIEHVWLLNGEEKARVELNIGSFNWRTYSSKRLNSVLQGDWVIQVWHQDTLLDEHAFTYQERE